MIRQPLFTLLMLTCMVLSAACNPTQVSPTPQPNMPNPASVYCEQQGNKLKEK
ncbi:MAG: DUF333 domain-containing protein [Chloroflexota bacterium]